MFMLTPLSISGSGTDRLVFCCLLDAQSEAVSAARANESWQELLSKLGLGVYCGGR
jgi:hypothetical protein